MEELIDWENIPDDPIFRLTFPQPEMLSPKDLNSMVQLLKDDASEKVIRQTANEIRLRLNPHPGGQKQHNVPFFAGQAIPGVQHKYQQTVLIFPTAGQQYPALKQRACPHVRGAAGLRQHCHAYCTFCFRWPQFVGMEDIKFATRESGYFQDYLREHKEITDVLLTGGDPMTMKARHLALYIEPLLQPEFDHIQTIRIGTKSVSYWPYRYVTDNDADDLLRLLEKVVQRGKHLAIMAHYEHWKELDTEIVQKAIARLRSTGAQIRTQAPVVRHINDSASTWAKMWNMQVRLGCIPYYMFVERQTGAKEYFEVPLIKVWEIYQQAIQQVSGLARNCPWPSDVCFTRKSTN